LRLDRRDIQQIVDTIETEEQPVEIVSEGYAYNSVAEIAEHFGHRRIAEMQIAGGGVRVSLGAETSSVFAFSYASEERSHVIAKCIAVDSLLKANRRLLTSTVTTIGQMVGLVLAGSSLSVPKHPGAPMRKLAVVAVGIAFGTVIFAAFRAYRTVLVLEEQHEPFLRRNQEKILIAVATSLITALVIFVTQRVFSDVTTPQPNNVHTSAKP